MGYSWRGAGVGLAPWSRPGRVARAEPPPVSTDQVMAGFIVWLARQGVPAGRRCRYWRYAECYLRWRSEHPAEPEDRFHAELRGPGSLDPESRVVGASIALLRRYLAAASGERAG